MISGYGSSILGGSFCCYFRTPFFELELPIFLIQILIKRDIFNQEDKSDSFYSLNGNSDSSEWC